MSYKSDVERKAMHKMWMILMFIIDKFLKSGNVGKSQHAFYSTAEGICRIKHGITDVSGHVIILSKNTNFKVNYYNEVTFVLCVIVQ